MKQGELFTRALKVEEYYMCEVCLVYAMAPMLLRKLTQSGC